jgi:hypothetical protein
MVEIFLKYKELLKRTPPLTAAEIEDKMIQDCGYTWQEIKMAQEYCTPPEKQNYWVDKGNGIPITNIRTPPPTPVPMQFWDKSINDATAQDWDAVRPDISEPNDATDPLSYQVGGDHYTKMKIQPIEYIHANKMDFMDGCIVGYISRWRDKGGVQDLQKIKQFVDLIIKMNKL